MNEIDLTEKLKQLEAEVDREVSIQNATRQRIWDEMTGNKPYGDTYAGGSSASPASGSNASTSPASASQASNSTASASQDAASQASDSQASTAPKITLEDINAPIITKLDFPAEEKWALTLAGGGAKGAYQLAVSGSSVGALNAALISLNEFDDANTIWTSIMPKQFLDINFDTIIGPLDTLVKRTLTNGLCSRDGLISIIDNYLNLNELATARIPAYVCVSHYTSECIECLNEKPEPEYISLSEVDAHDAKQLLLASSAMPYVYPPEIIHDKVYRDGGLSDNVPVMPMTTVGADKLIVVKLEPDDKVNTSLYSKFSEVVEIVPSREIGDLLDGTLEFTNRNVDFRVLLGYYDALRTFSLRMYRLNGLPVNEAEKKRREDADYEKILSTLKQKRTLGRANDNIDKLKNLLSL